MHKFAIICLDDDPMVVHQLTVDLTPFSSLFDVICAYTIEEADLKIEEIEQKGQHLALVICDNELNQQRGVDFLIKLSHQDKTRPARKILLNDLLQLETIMAAVNEGRLDHCMTKPWQPEDIQPVIRRELTNFILKSAPDNWLKYSPILDTQRILKSYFEQKMANYRSGFLNYHDLDDQDLSNQVISALYDFFDGNDDGHACRTYSKNHHLTIEGDPNYYLWFIVEGSVALFKQDNHGEKHEVIRHGSGALVGGMSFISGEPSFSTGITLAQTKVIKLDKKLFAKVMHTRSELLPLFTNLLLRHFNRRIKSSITTEMALQSTLKSLEVAQQELINKEKMAMLGQLVSGVAHELNNPISAILRGADTLKKSIPSLLNNTLNEQQQQQGINILQQALVSKPISTMVMREESKKLTPIIEDRHLAKKVVLMGLSRDQQIEHWIKPLGSQRNQVIQQWHEFYQAGNFLRSINVCSQRISDLVKSLKSYARQDLEMISTIDIHEGLEDTLTIFDNQLKKITVIKDYADLPLIECHPIALQQVWTNLISNALDAMNALKRSNLQENILTVSTQYIHDSLSPRLVIIIEDNGEGISPEKIERIFELNFTTKSEGNFGLGIGLSICQQIVHQHNGSITVHSKLDQFTKMVVTLPLQSNIFNQPET
ncbi:ATP-binding protein [Vibrio sp. SS-MA-C1-2]|uniref:ATP-binding protein n=1 Tax=Vibrio sp. SS-MA-C1-2 TaxID=2908646 RepID=UPI001F378380|nr:ATP-binding protein [Vibrio sp. SS-MA-C1-2]UJF20006.1 ATP-binding protein [Vibrio sp. SS-MA-C1-2]